MEITHQIEENHLSNVLKTSTKEWDGDMWYAVSRKWRNICSQGSLEYHVRPFWYMDDRSCGINFRTPVIQTAFNVPAESIKELKAW